MQELAADRFVSGLPAEKAQLRPALQALALPLRQPVARDAPCPGCHFGPEGLTWSRRAFRSSSNVPPGFTSKGRGSPQAPPAREVRATVAAVGQGETWKDGHAKRSARLRAFRAAPPSRLTAAGHNLVTAENNKDGGLPNKALRHRKPGSSWHQRPTRDRNCPKHPPQHSCPSPHSPRPHACR